MAHELLKANAVANLDQLLTMWGIPFVKVSDTEYDFLSPLREDKSFGACRFNTQKGIGADFSGFQFNPEDFKVVSDSFDVSDFAGINKKGTWGFDVISLCMKINNLGSYDEAVAYIGSQLNDISHRKQFIKITPEMLIKKKQENEQAKKRKLEMADKMWGLANALKNTLAEKYLNSRAIFLQSEHQNIKFHPKMLNKELGKFLPVLLFKVTNQPGSELKAIHRIFLSEDGKSKADVSNPKMALGDIQGNAIWIGKKSDILAICEGPENALSIYSLGFDFVCSTINAANFSCLTIPKYVKKVILFPDNDEPGRKNAKKAQEKYKSKYHQTVYPKNGDWNDVIVRAKNEVTEDMI